MSQNLSYRDWLEDNDVSIVMDDIQCNEDDKNISNCRARLMLHNCGHGKDIWLQCKGIFLKSINKGLERLNFKYTSNI